MSTQPITDFESASREVLAFLSRRFGFGLWMVTRTLGDDWILLHTEGSGYDLKPGAVFRWKDSICSAMMQGNGPHIAPDTARIPSYASAPINRQIPIGAYIGVPLVHSDGSLFGTLCAIDPKPQSPELVRDQEIIELFARLLSAILQADLRATQYARASERLLAESLNDDLTGLYNRRGWDRLLAGEEERCRRHGHAATVFVIDLDNLKETNDKEGHAAGDNLIVRAAGALRLVRSADVVARLGGDEFGILSVECGREGAPVLAARLSQALENSGVQASMGFFTRHPALGLEEAWKAADMAMYAQKRTRKAAR